MMHRLTLPLAFVVLAVVGVRPARADGFLDGAVGIMLPASDSDWTKNVDPSPKLGVRVGGTSSTGRTRAGIAVGADWTNVRSSSMNFGIGTVDASANRFRILASFVLLHAVSAKSQLSLRAGGGVDIMHLSYSGNLLGVPFDGSGTDTGYAIELAGGGWYDVADSVALGGEIGLPIGHHSQHKYQDAQINGYTSVDVDFLFGIRLKL